jgi:hypothetical protein
MGLYIMMRLPDADAEADADFDGGRGRLDIANMLPPPRLRI